jgi:hypothetical protein
MKRLDSRTLLQAGAKAQSRGPSVARAEPELPRMTALKASLPLTDISVPKERRKATSYNDAKAGIEEREGSLTVDEVPHVGVRVRGRVTVDAGCPTSIKRLKVNVNPDKYMTVKLDREIDEEIVDAVMGYGMGALDVTFRVKKYGPVYGEAEYVITTNDSLACTEDKKVQVALSLLRAAEMVEEMLSRGYSNVVKLSDFMGKDQAQKEGQMTGASSDAQAVACLKR